METAKLTSTMTNLLSEIQDLRAKVEHQASEINQLKANQSSPSGFDNTGRTSRRKLLKRMAVVAIGATAATTALTTTTGEVKASAIGTVTGASTTVYGLTAAPNGISPHTPSTGSYGLIGRVSQGTGVYGYSSDVTGSGIGVFGKSTNSYGFGMQAEGTAYGVFATGTQYAGVYGKSQYGAGVSGSSDTLYGGSFSGGKAPIALGASTTITGAPSGNTLHDAGELFVDKTGTLYYCTVQGNPGTWVRLNQPYVAGNNITISPRNLDGTFTISATGTATPVTSVNGQTGAVILPPNISLLATPVRVAATVAPFNAPPLRSTGATPAIGNSSTVQLTIAGANNVPPGAKGVIGVLTNVGATSGGNLRFWTDGIAPNVANLNIPGAMPSLNLTASFAIPLDTNGKTYLGFGTGTVGATCGYVVDVSAYWL